MHPVTIDLSALLLLVAVTPICLWVAWSDVATMKIPNKAVLATMAVFAVIGLIVFPLDVYLWRWAQFAIVLAVGFVLSTIRVVGAGDAKFAAAMAPFIASVDTLGVLMLFSVILLVAFATHRAMRAVPAVRGAFPHWESWERKEFPMGLALASALVFYLALAALYGQG